MTDTNQEESNASEESHDTNFPFACCDFKNMGKMIKDFFAGQDGGFDCETMMGQMQRMFKGFEKKP